MSLITSVIGGIMGGHAAGTAANAQVGADQEASTTVNNAAVAGNKTIADATTDAQGKVIAAGTTANAALNPYSEAGTAASGTLQAGLVPGGDFNKTPTLADLQLDPGYAFRVQQGQLALERGAAARGTVQSGGELRDLDTFAQGTASQEYQNAFARFQQDTQARYGRLSGTADRGLNAATTMGQNTIGTNEFAGQLGYNSGVVQANNSNAAATYTGNAQIQAGNSRAAGILNKQNAYNGMLSSIGSTFNNAALGYMGGGGFTGAVKGAVRGY